MKKRSPNSSHDFGGIEMETLGQVPDAAKYSEVTVNEAPDSELAYALAGRGYDVKLKAPTAEVIAKRKKRLGKE